jgi:hypothetical protein
MVSTRTRPRPQRKVVAEIPAEQPTAPIEPGATEPRLRAVKAPVQREAAPPDSPVVLQRRAARGELAEDKINVRLLITGSDDDGIRAYDEQLPISIVRAILSPEISDFFIPIVGSARTKPPRTKSHWLHTSAIREVLILDDVDLFPEEATQ